MSRYAVPGSDIGPWYSEPGSIAQHVVCGGGGEEEGARGTARCHAQAIEHVCTRSWRGYNCFSADLLDTIVLKRVSAFVPGAGRGYGGAKAPLRGGAHSHLFPGHVAYNPKIEWKKYGGKT
eukprot:1103942-Rhodomonas_salina.4